MLVYLDSGDIANLERLSSQDPPAFDEFLNGWVARGCTLALSLHHAQEIAQLADDTSRKRRLATLARFPEIRYECGGSHKVVWLETLTQLLARLEGSPADYSRDVSPAFFQQVGLTELADTVSKSGDQLRTLEAEQTATANIRNSSRGFRPPHSYRRQTRDKIDVGRVESAMMRMLASESLTPHTRAAAEPLLRGLNDHLALAPDARVAFERAYGLEGYDVIRSVDDEDLHRVATFFSVAKDAAAACAQEFAVEVARCEAATRTLDPYECPGASIEMAVSRAQDSSSQAADASDEPDRAHVSFLPYVDAMFADRRTVGFYEQAARSGRRKDLLVRYAVRLKRSGQPKRLLEEIDTIAQRSLAICSAKVSVKPDSPSNR